MRAIIQVASGLFVILGAIIFLISTKTVVSGMNNPGDGSNVWALTIGVGAWVGSALIILIGGTSYLLAEIDIKLERIAAAAGSSGSGSAPDNSPMEDYLG